MMFLDEGHEFDTSQEHHGRMTPTSPLAGIVTGLIDGLLIAAVVMLVVMLNNRRHRLARARLRSATPVDPREPGEATQEPFHRAA